MKPADQTDMFAADKERAASSYYLIQISGRGFMAGLVFEKQGKQWVCVRAAPIVRYFLGWDAHKVKDYIDKKRWGYEKVEQFHKRAVT